MAVENNIERRFYVRRDKVRIYLKEIAEHIPGFKNGLKDFNSALTFLPKFEKYLNDKLGCQIPEIQKNVHFKIRENCQSISTTIYCSLSDENDSFDHVVRSALVEIFVKEMIRNSNSGDIKLFLDKVRFHISKSKDLLSNIYLQKEKRSGKDRRKSFQGRL